MKNLYANPRLLTLSSCALLLIAAMLGNDFTTTVVGIAIFLLGSGFGVKGVNGNAKQRALAVFIATAGAALAVTIWALRASMATV